MPATVGYQPTLISEVGELEERITSTTSGDITSVQAVYVPADDMTDPAVSAILNHLDTTVILSRAQAGKGIYPAVDPLQSSSKLMDRHVLGDQHYRVAEKVREHLARYRELEDIIAMLGIEELSPSDRHDRFARAQIATLSHAALLRRGRAHRSRGRICAAGVKPCAIARAFIRGGYDDLPEDKCYMRGNMQGKYS